MEKQEAHKVNIGDTLAYSGEYRVVERVILHGAFAPYFEFRGLNGRVPHRVCALPVETIYEGYNKADRRVSQYIKEEHAERARAAGMIARWQSRQVEKKEFELVKAACERLAKGA